jgi:DNA uptake protein ComE-like DNA-binding protein
MPTRTYLHLSVALTALSLASACGPQDVAWDEVDGELDEAQLALTLSSSDTALVLAVVNDPATTAAVLTGRAGVEARAATNLVARRNGADGRAGTADDVRFTTLAQVDAVPWVGDAALRRLLAFAKTNLPQQTETVEGVTFQPWEVSAVVWGVNQATSARLSSLVDARAAAGLVASRPFQRIAQMGAVAWVGPTVLERLRREAATWQIEQRGSPRPPAGLGGTFDGITFSDALATKALDIANRASREQLLGRGIGASPAASLVASRPFATLADVAALSGVGPSTMQALADYAASGTFSGAALDALALRAQLLPLTRDLWLTSETDARLLVVSAPGLGAAPINERSIRELLTAQHDALLPNVMWVEPSAVPLSRRLRVERHDALAFLSARATAADPSDPIARATAARFAALRDFLAANVQDLVVYRFGTITISTFIVGRSADGQLVGLLTGQVET